MGRCKENISLCIGPNSGIDASGFGIQIVANTNATVQAHICEEDGSFDMQVSCGVIKDSKGNIFRGSCVAQYLRSLGTNISPDLHDCLNKSENHS